MVAAQNNRESENPKNQETKKPRNQKTKERKNEKNEKRKNTTRIRSRRNNMELSPEKSTVTVFDKSYKKGDAVSTFNL